jgi:hypothetical protein
MKSAQLTPTATPAKKNTSFFNKESEQGFFHPMAIGSSINEQPFFSKSRNNNYGIQTKLTVGEPNDIYEKEADSMADKVVQRLAQPKVITRGDEAVQTKPLSTSFTPFVQAKCAHCEEEDKLQKKEKEDDKDLSINKLQRKPFFENNAAPSEDEKKIQRKCTECEKEEKLQKKSDNSSQTTSSGIEGRLNSSKGSGSLLPASTREQMENSFGANFSNVRIHNDRAAVQMNKDLNAQAFTHGSDIYFNSGKYDTNSKNGNHLLAHELTHVVQQANKGLQRKPEKRPQKQSFLSTSENRVQRFDLPFGYETDFSWRGVKTAAGVAADTVKEGAVFVKDKAVEGAEWIYDEIKSLINDGKQWLLEQWDSIKELASSGWQELKNAFSDIINIIKTPFNIIANAIVNFDYETLKTAWQTFSDFITNTWKGFKLLTDKLLGLVESIWGGIEGIISSLISKVDSLTHNFLFNHLPDSVQETIHKLIDGIKNLWTSISNAWHKIFDVIKSWIDDALDTIIKFIKKVSSFAMNVIIEGIKEFAEIIAFLKDLFANPQKYIDILAKKSVAALDGVEKRFAGIVDQYFPADNKTAATTNVSGIIQKKPAATSEVKNSASWRDIGSGVWAMMGKKWEEFKANPWAVVKGLLMDLIFPMVGNIKDIINLGKDIWKIVTGPLSAGSLDEFWTSLLMILDIPILIYNTIVSILMRTLMIPLIVASFIPHPLVKAIAAAVGYGLLGAFVQGELLNIGQKLLLLKTGKTTTEQKKEAYNRIADSLIAMAMTAAIILLMLILHFLGNIIKGVYNFVKGKIFPVESRAPEVKLGEGEGKGTEETKGAGEEPKLEGEVPSNDGQREIKVTERGKIWVCASPCEELRLKYEAQIKDNPKLEERIKALEDGYSDLTPEEKSVRDGEIKQLEQELADTKLAQEGGVRSPKKSKWPPVPPEGDKPPINAPDAAEWRYQRYAYEKFLDGAKPKEVLPPDEWMRRYFNPTAEGGRPGRPGGPEQVAAKNELAKQGIRIVENVELGGRYPDGVDPNLNPKGGTGYYEVGKMLDSGIPEARERVKIGDEIKAMGPNDTVTFVDKTNPAKRVTYGKGSTPEVPSSKTF